MVPPPRPPESLTSAPGSASPGLVSEPISIPSSELRNELTSVQQTAALLRRHSGHPSLSADQEAFPPLPGLIPHAAPAFPTSSFTPDFPYLSCLFSSFGLHRPINLLPPCCNPTRPSRAIIAPALPDPVLMRLGELFFRSRCFPTFTK